MYAHNDRTQKLICSILGEQNELKLSKPVHKWLNSIAYIFIKNSYFPIRKDVTIYFGCELQKEIIRDILKQKEKYELYFNQTNMYPRPFLKMIRFQKIIVCGNSTFFLGKIEASTFWKFTLNEYIHYELHIRLDVAISVMLDYNLLRL